MLYNIVAKRPILSMLYNIVAKRIRPRKRKRDEMASGAPHVG